MKHMNYGYLFINNTEHKYNHCLPFLSKGSTCITEQYEVHPFPPAPLIEVTVFMSSEVTILLSVLLELNILTITRAPHKDHDKGL